MFSSLDRFICIRLNTRNNIKNMYVLFLFIFPRWINKDITYNLLPTCRIIRLYHGHPVLFPYLYSNQLYSSKGPCNWMLPHKLYLYLRREGYPNSQVIQGVAACYPLLLFLTNSKVPSSNTAKANVNVANDLWLSIGFPRALLFFSSKKSIDVCKCKLDLSKLNEHAKRLRVMYL